MFEDLFEQAKSIEWAQIAIKDISGPEVTAQTLLHFKNETEQSTTTTTNVETGIGDLGLFVVRSNLNQNDLLYVGDDSAVINETTIKTYSTSSRQVNHQSITSEYNISDDEAADLNMTGFQQTNSQDIFWDRQLGVLVEMSFNMKTRSQTVNADMSLSVKLVETNVFSIPEFPTWTLVFIAFTMTALVAILYKKKNGPLFPECVEYKKS